LFGEVSYERLPGGRGAACGGVAAASDDGTRLPMRPGGPWPPGLRTPPEELARRAQGRCSARRGPGVATQGTQAVGDLELRVQSWVGASRPVLRPNDSHGHCRRRSAEGKRLTDLEAKRPSAVGLVANPHTTRPPVVHGHGGSRETGRHQLPRPEPLTESTDNRVGFVGTPCSWGTAFSAPFHGSVATGASRPRGPPGRWPGRVRQRSVASVGWACHDRPG